MNDLLTWLEAQPPAYLLFLGFGLTVCITGALLCLPPVISWVRFKISGPEAAPEGGTGLSPRLSNDSGKRTPPGRSRDLFLESEWDLP